jgi:16S rRNA (guanine(1405)-N(7))-methyltransferase
VDRETDALDRIIAVVLASPKYRGISEGLVREVGKRELAKRRNLREAITATKSKLHQVAAVYLDRDRDYGEWLEDLRKAHESGDRDSFRKACLRTMAYHSSTRERIPVLDQFYGTILAGLSPVRSVLDIACGLNPLAIPWMPLAADAEYFAYDVYEDMVGFLAAFMKLIGVRGRAETRDVIRSCPTQQAQVALVLKALPCLEQIDKSAGLRILDALNAEHLVVSFPVHSLGGRNRGMVANYEARFRELVANKGWGIKRFEFATELAFLVSK